MRNAQRALLSLALMASLASCGKKSDSAVDGDSDLTYSAESAITSIAAVADEQNGSSFALRQSTASPTYYVERFFEEALPKAHALGCTRAVTSTCSGGIRQATYTGCTIPGTLLTLTGYVALTYSDSLCSMSVNNNYVTRTYDYSIDGPRGGSLNVFSTNQTDYNGTSFMGGGKLTKTAAGWDIDILGKNKVLTYRGRQIMNHSIKTTSTIKVTGTLARTGRTISGGAVQVSHNLAKFTATYGVHSGSPLVWSGTCCHPTSGQLDITYTGSVTGSATLVFGSCGTATLTKNSQTTSVDLTYCE